VVAAGNRVKDKAAAQRMPSALKNRLGHIHCCVDVPAWANWAVANDIPAEVIAFARFRQDLVGVMPRGDENAFLSPRSLTEASKYVNAPVGQRKRLFAGLIGAGQASELDGFIGLYRSLGSLDEVLKNPSSAKVPSEPSEQYAVATGIARLATRKTMAAVCEYSDRLPNDIGVLAVTDAVRRDRSLANTSAFGSWAVNHQDITV
jgi:hypothetical protein